MLSLAMGQAYPSLTTIATVSPLCAAVNPARRLLSAQYRRAVLLKGEQMEFCPTCGSMLLYELPNMENPARFYCPTCPYVCQIENRVKVKRSVRLVKKPIDPIFSEDDRKNLNETEASCPDCGHGKASFTQVQTRSADEPMTVFYTCIKCRHTWTEN